MDQYPNINLKAYTSVPEYNYYLSNVKSTPVSTNISEPTTGLMMLLSLFQYQSSYAGPTYSNAVEQASKAAYVQSGGKKIEDSLKEKGITLVHDIGITNTESAIALGAAKTFQSKQFNWDNLKINTFKIHMGLTPNSGNIGVKYEFQ